jgi:hypothetical protein
MNQVSSHMPDVREVTPGPSLEPNPPAALCIARVILGLLSKLNFDNRNATLTLTYSTYLGSSFDAGDGIAVDARGNAYVTGGTQSADFPLRAPAARPQQRPRARRLRGENPNVSSGVQ